MDTITDISESVIDIYRKFSPLGSVSFSQVWHPNPNYHWKKVEVEVMGRSRLFQILAFHGRLIENAGEIRLAGNKRHGQIVASSGLETAALERLAEMFEDIRYFKDIFGKEFYVDGNPLCTGFYVSDNSGALSVGFYPLSREEAIEITSGRSVQPYIANMMNNVITLLEPWAKGIYLTQTG